MNTNTKNYLLNAIDGDGYDVELKSNKDKIEFVLYCFNSEFNYMDNKYRYPYLTKRFAEWLMGLPSSINVDFYNHKIIELGIEWGLIDNNTPPSKVDKYLNGWFIFIAGEFFKLAEKERVNYYNL